MKKNIYTGIFCTILGLCINTPANASIISRSFLDEALTDYATTTALDLKANQSDFRELNTQISDSVDLLRELLIRGSTSYEFVNNINPEKFPNTISGAFGLLYQYLDGFAGSILYGWTDSNGRSYAGFNALNNGWTDSEKNTYLGVKGLNDKIALPSGDMHPSKGLAFLLPDTEYYTYPTSIGDFMGQMYNGYLGLSGLADAVYHGSKYTGQTDTALQVKGLRQITDEIGTLPSGEVYPITRIMNMYDKHYPNTHDWPFRNYPTSVQDLILSLYGPSDTQPTSVGFIPHVLGIFEDLVWPHEDMYQQFGTLPEGITVQGMYEGWTDSEKNTYLGVKGLNDKIGTLPTTLSALPPFIEIFGMDENIDLPTDIGGILSLLFSTDGGKPTFYGLANAIMRGYVSSDGTSVPGLRGINDKIGTLPGDYENVGAALTTIDAKIGTLPIGGLPEANTAMYDLFKFTQDTDTPRFPKSLSDLIYQLYGNTEGEPGAIAFLLKGFEYNESNFSDEYDGNVGVLPAMELGISATQAAETAQETANRAKALAESNATAIGTLPTALALYEYDANGTLGNTRYPTADVFGTNNNIGGMLTAILIGFGDTSGHRVLSLPEISTRTVRLSDQIGTLPSGSLLGNTPAMDVLFSFTQNTDTPVFPNSLSDLINQLYGSKGGKPGAISALLHGFEFTFGEYNGPVGVLPAMELSLSVVQTAKTALATANRAKALAESNATAIGTLPDGYETVGAALSAIKGIAEEAKAAALAAIPDPKTEGSNGKYVLTVDIVGDNATYRWEPIDRSKTTTTTE